MKYFSILCLLTLSLFACKQNKTENKEAENGESPAGILQFHADKKLEMLYFVFLLSDYPVLSQHTTAYKTTAIKHFKQYENHKAVQLAKALIEKGFVADYAVNWLYQYSDFPEFKKTRTINFPFDQRPINQDSLTQFSRELASFHRDAKCDSFLQSQQAFLQQMADSVKISVKDKNFIEVIEDYFGIHKQASYRVILSPLLHSGGFAIERTDVNEQYVLIGPNSVKNGKPEFDKVYLEQDLIIHEFSHNYANPVTEQFLDESRKFEHILFPAIKEKVNKEGYETWESFMTELIVRATTIRIVEKMYGKEAANELAEYEKSAGFQYAIDISDELKVYEEQRDKYPKFDAFFPLIIARLDQMSKSLN